MTDLDTPGQRIRFLRVGRGWSQETLGKKVQASQVAVSHWERNARRPGRLAQTALAEELGVTRHFLFGEEAA